jgi:transketolase
MSAAHFRLSNFTVIIDRNRLCYDGTTDEIMSLGDLSAKFEAFGFNTVNCDGHDIEALLGAFSDKAADRPNAIIAETVKGHSISFAENRPEWHQKAMTDEQYEQALKEITEAE